MAPYRNTRSGSSKCHLFELSPELRNTIYRLALVSNNTIEVGAADAPPMDPPLLMTCRQIRREARGIYYQENTVNFTALDYDVRKIVTWLDRSRRSGAPGTGRACAPGQALVRAVTAWADEMLCDHGDATRVHLLGGYLGTADIVDHLTGVLGLPADGIHTPARFGLATAR